jgi:hypothetical protein
VVSYGELLLHGPLEAILPAYCTTGRQSRSSRIVVAGPPRSKNVLFNFSNHQREDRSKKCYLLVRQSSSIFILMQARNSFKTYPFLCYVPFRTSATRVKILDQRSWLNETKALFLFSVLAGVSKSAIIQTFTEVVGHPVYPLYPYWNPNRIFTTIAYQFVVRI